MLSFHENVAYQSQVGSPAWETHIVGGYEIPNFPIWKILIDSKTEVNYVKNSLKSWNKGHDDLLVLKEA